MGDPERTRRDFLQLGGAAAVLGACARRRAAPASLTSTRIPPIAPGDVPRRRLGATGAEVSILALGGYHLGSAPSDDDASRIVHEAMDAGIFFFDNAWEYHDGKSEERLGRALAGRREKAFVMTKVCTHGRDAGVAMQQLEQSLRRLQTDHVDLWQVHECIYATDPELHFAEGGVVEALERAKKQGKTRFVGFTGHKDPDIHLRMLAHGFPFDTVQMPLNCFDASFRSFETRVLPEVNHRGIAALGMKSMGGQGEPILAGIVSADEALRYALSLPVAAVVSGVDRVDVLRQNLAIARGFRAMSAEEMDALRARVAPVAADGHMELYKTTLHFDAKVGREQHGFPTAAEVPL